MREYALSPEGCVVHEFPNRIDDVIIAALVVAGGQESHVSLSEGVHEGVMGLHQEFPVRGAAVLVLPDEEYLAGAGFGGLNC
jgi:phosphatidate phosphatase APP1